MTNENPAPDLPPASATCPSCGNPLTQDAPEGLCPRCLAAINFGDETLFSAPGSTLPPPPVEEIAPHFPQLEILSCLGRGGMGVVYKARQISLDRLVALKLLAPEREKDPEFSERFAREAQALARMSHPHIVTVHDFGQAGGFFYLLMEFVDGANLRQLLQSHRFTPEQALGVVPPLCDALQYAHDRGIVHRDIKPENLLMDREGKLKVADFGLAKMLDVAGEERPMGTPGYMAPEQAGDPAIVDNRADIYSLGVVIYEMLTGELPAKAFEPPSRKTGVDSRMDEVVSRAMQQEPAQRYQQASILKTEVENISREIPPVPPPRATVAATPQETQVAYRLPVGTDLKKLRESIKWPAILMMIASALMVLVRFETLQVWLAALFNLSGPWTRILGSVGLDLVLVAAGVLSFIGANKMRAFQSHSLAKASAIMLIVCGIASLASSASLGAGLVVLIQLVAGVWGLATLGRTPVKELFDAHASGTALAGNSSHDPARTDEVAKLRENIRGAAVAMMVVSALTMIAGQIFGGLANTVVRVFFKVASMQNRDVDAPALLGIFPAALGTHSFRVYLFMTFILLVAGVIAFIGANRMRTFRSHGWGMASALILVCVAVVFLPGISVALGGFLVLAQLGCGVWGLVALTRGGAKELFGLPAEPVAAPMVAGAEPRKSATGWIIGAAVAAVLMIMMLVGAVAFLFYFQLKRSETVRHQAVVQLHQAAHQVSKDSPRTPMVPGTGVQYHGGPATEEELQVRYQASQMIGESAVRDKALSSIAIDAAAAGNVPMVHLAIGRIGAIQLRDETSGVAAYTLSDGGMKLEGVKIASAMSGVNLRDKTLAGLAMRGLPGGPDTEDGLRARQEAAGLVQGITSRSEAFSALPKDAAALGNLSVARAAIGSINDIQLRDETSAAVAITARNRGLRSEAVQIASEIGGVSLRDKTLGELSASETLQARPVPAESRSGESGE